MHETSGVFDGITSFVIERVKRDGRRLCINKRRAYMERTRVNIKILNKKKL